MKLIKDWKQCLKFFSVQLSLVGTAMSTTYATLYDKMKDTIPATTMMYITGAVFVMSIVGRVISQGMESES
jgi:hypothetical protein